MTKNLCPSSYFPGEGESKMIGLAYAVAPIGGSIHRGGLMEFRGHPRITKALGEEAAKRLVDPKVYEGQAIVVAIENDFVAALNALEACMPLCIDSLFEDDLARLISAATGIDMDGDGFMKVGERIFNVEKAFNIREGLRRKDDILPQRFFVEEVTPYGIKGLNAAKFQAMLDEYYKFRGWNEEGIPTKKKLDELNLGYIAEQIGAA